MLLKSFTILTILALPSPILDYTELVEDRPQRQRGNWEQVDTTPRTGYYLDVPTRTLYYYDAGTDTLTPTFEPALEQHYVAIDVYPRGETPSPETISQPGQNLRCDMDFCISLTVAIVGGDYSLAMHAHAVGDDCLNPLEFRRDFGQGNPMTDKVQYVMGQWGINYCSPGEASADIRLNGFPAEADVQRY